MARCPLADVASVSQPISKRGQVTVIASGKGGVGKTNLALNLGIQLARRNQRVILLDADFGLANTDILLDISPLADLSDLLTTQRPVDELLVSGPAGLRILCGVSGPPGAGCPPQLAPAACEQVIRRLETECDVLVVDCAAGVAPPVVAFALMADLLILATTPEPTALADAYATLKLLCLHGVAGRVGVVVNMTRSRSEARSAAGRLGQVARRFLGLSLEDLGHVPRDRHVPLAVRQRVPVAVRYPHCPATACMNEVSKRVRPPRPEAGTARGTWARVASLFL